MSYARSWAAGFVTLVVGFALTGVAAAASITIVNFSFEDPPQADGGFGFTSGVATGWVATSGSGVWRPNATQLPQGPTHLLQVGYSNEIGLGLSQDLTGVFLTANTLYTLLVDVQSRADCCQNVSSTLQLRTSTGFVLATSTLAGGPAAGDDALQTTTYFAGPLDPNLGATLQIALLAGGAQSDWDNVRLDATAVPEPTTLLLWGTIAAGLGAARWRRRGRSLAS